MKLLEVAQTNYLNHMDTRNFPACFDSSRQFEAWQAVESIAHTKPRALPCRDCTGTYYCQMVEAGRCAQSELPKVQRLFGKGT
jgi:hypothetical protein